MDGFQAYGAGKAGGAFDPTAFLRQPQTVVRILCWLFSIVILGCIANEGYVNQPDEVEEHCIFNRNQNVCNYGVAMGMLCFLCSAGFLTLDIYFPQISGVKDRKKAVMADIGVSVGGGEGRRQSSERRSRRRQSCHRLLLLLCFYLGCSVYLGCPEVQAGIRLCDVQPGIHRPQQTGSSAH